jgi:hypothetical protein
VSKPSHVSAAAIGKILHSLVFDVKKPVKSLSNCAEDDYKLLVMNGEDDLIIVVRPWM